MRLALLVCLVGLALLAGALILKDVFSTERPRCGASSITFIDGVQSQPEVTSCPKP